MSLINKNNYEAFLLDYVEGNLSVEHIAELMLFLENHPELKEDLEDFDLLELENQPAIFDNKDALKIKEDSVTAITFDDVAIAEIEGENTPKQSNALTAFISAHPEKRRDFELYQKTKLRPTLVRFNGKQALFQEEDKAIALYWWYSAAAAVILILFLLNGLSSSDQATNDVKIAEENRTEEPIQDESTTIDQNKVVANQTVKEPINEQVNTIEVNQKEKLQKQKAPVAPSPNEDESNIEEKQLAIQEDNTNVPNQVSPDSTTNTESTEDFLADQVKIVYEDEVVKSTPDEQGDIYGQKTTKFDVVRAAVKQQLKGLFGNAKKDLEVLTASAEEALSRKK